MLCHSEVLNQVCWRYIGFPKILCKSFHQSICHIWKVKVNAKDLHKHAKREPGGRLSKVAISKIHKLYDPERGLATRRAFPRVLFKNQELHVLKRLMSFTGFAEKEVLVQSFVYSKFNFCPLVW